MECICARVGLIDSSSHTLAQQIHRATTRTHTHTHISDAHDLGTRGVRTSLPQNGRIGRTRAQNARRYLPTASLVCRGLLYTYISVWVCVCVCTLLVSPSCGTRREPETRATASTTITTDCVAPVAFAYATNIVRDTRSTRFTHRNSLARSLALYVIFSLALWPEVRK